MKITMKQLAESLGVSRTTVSLVLKGKGNQARISSATQERILSRVKELDYRPNYFASALNYGKTGTVGIVFPDVFENFMSTMVKGIEDILYREGITILLSTSRFDPEREKRIIDQFMHRAVDGIIIAYTAPYAGTPADYTHLENLIRQGIPLVMVDRYLPGLPTCRVIQEDRKMACRAISQLISTGTRRITCISFNLEITSLKDRVNGYVETMREAGLKPVKFLLHKQDPAADDLSCYIDELAENDRLPEAFFITTSGIADKLVWLLEKRGVTVGKDIMVCRFGNPPQWSSGPCIHIPQPTYAMGQRAAEELLTLIAGDSPPVERTVTCPL